MSIPEIGSFLILLVPGAVAQVTADPNDAAIAVVQKPDTAESKHLASLPSAVAVAGLGKLVYRNPNGSQTTILGSVTRRDPQSGASVPSTLVLSTTKNGWHLDGSHFDVLLRRENRQVQEKVARLEEAR